MAFKITKPLSLSQFSKRILKLDYAKLEKKCMALMSKCIEDYCRRDAHYTFAMYMELSRPNLDFHAWTFIHNRFTTKV